VAKLFFLVSGEFETLSVAELLAILEAENYLYRLTEKLDQTIRLEADIESVKQVHRRAGYARVCGLELFTCDATDEAITEAANNTDFKNSLAEGETFEVRIRRIKEYTTKEATMHYERLLGKLILQKNPHAKVNLKNPSKTFYGILTNGKLVFGIKLAEIQPKPFVERRARKKPFFHPSAMNAKLARCMVNLAYAKTGTYVLDPFCGTGSTAIEATLIGCRAIGIDVQGRMANGAKRNMNHFGLTPEGIMRADARQLPLIKVDCVVTDPPYGRSSTTLKSNTKAIVEGVLASAYDLLGTGQRICIALPIKGNVLKPNSLVRMSSEIKDLIDSLGYRKVESHELYYHRSLTREVIVYEKT
jgi:tRNA (guanine10-N2)-dimethyltransferase